MRLEAENLPRVSPVGDARAERTTAPEDPASYQLAAAAGSLTNFETSNI